MISIDRNTEHEKEMKKCCVRRGSVYLYVLTEHKLDRYH